MFWPAVFRSCVLGVLGTCVSAAEACAQSEARIEVLHTSAPGFAQREIAGAPGRWIRDIGRIEMAANGRYALKVLDQNLEEVLLRDGSFFLSTGDPAPWLAGGTVRNILDFGINSNGEVMLDQSSNAGFQFLNGLVRYDGSVSQLVVESGKAIPGLPGASYGFFGEVGIVENGQAVFSNTYSLGIPGAGTIVFSPGGLLAQTGVTIPAGQFGVPVPWSALGGAGELTTNADGSRWVMRGALDTGSAFGSDAVEVDGQVVVQQGFVVPGSSFADPVSRVLETSMSPSGEWWITGVNVGEIEAWAIRNGSLVAQSGAPLVPGDARLWMSGLGASFPFACTSQQQSYLGGYFADANGQAVPAIVWNDSDVVLVGGDAVDLDGNGLFDEQASFDGMDAAASCVVDPRGRLLVVANLRLEGDPNLYPSLIRISPRPPVLEITNLVAGQTANIQLSGGEPGVVARAAFSLAGPGPTALMGESGPLTLALSAPWFPTSNQIIDAAGQAQWSQAVPPALSGAFLWSQGAMVEKNWVELTSPLASSIQ